MFEIKLHEKLKKKSLKKLSKTALELKKKLLNKAVLYLRTNNQKISFSHI